jgi:predicted small lipoprotein YifL
MMKALALLLFISLAGCGGPLSLLTGGGPNVAANVQAGKENVQQAVVKQERIEAGRDVVQQTSPVVADRVDEVNIQQTPIWMILLLILGWLLPSPNEIARSIRGIFKKWTT